MVFHSINFIIPDTKKVRKGENVLNCVAFECFENSHILLIVTPINKEIRYYITLTTNYSGANWTEMNRLITKNTNDHEYK